jgi:hypothetical protein
LRGETHADNEPIPGARELWRNNLRNDRLPYLHWSAGRAKATVTRNPYPHLMCA